MKVTVLGGLGLMGEACLHDLARSSRVSAVEAVDLNAARAEKVLRRIPNRRKIRVHVLDFTDHAAARKALAGTKVVVNCAWYELNLKAMDLALALGAHYVDLGGLYHTTLKQLKRDAEFRKAGLLAVLGCGSTPGITNMMAQRLSEDFDRIGTVGIFDASHEEPAGPASGDFVPPFSVRTMMDEYEMPAPVLRDGRIKMVRPFSEEEELELRPPLGRGVAAACIHSELATLPAAFRLKGVRNMHFKIVYPEAVRRQLHLLVQLGFSKTDPVRVNGGQASPRNFLTAMALQGAAKLEAPPRDFEVLRVSFDGTKGGRPLAKSWDCEISCTNALSAGAMGVGYTASIAAQLILSGRTLVKAGVRAPEGALPHRAFFRELLGRKVFSLSESARRAVANI